MGESSEGNLRDQSKGGSSFANLLSPLRIGGVETRNRIAVAPMQEYMSGPGGEITEQTLGYIGARAKGGAGLVISGVMLGTRLAAEYPMGRSMFLFHPQHQLGPALYAERIHHFGALACAQMSPGMGRQCTPYEADAVVPAASDDLPYEITREKMFNSLQAVVERDQRSRMVLRGPLTRALTVSEIQGQTREFAASCQLAVLCGFDMIEIHATHGFLCHQFLSLLSNKRTDLYGGEWRNRKRFLNELMEATRYACQGVPIGVRISAEEHMEGGLSRDEMVDVARDLEARGADYIHLSDGAGFEEVGHQIPDADRAAHMADHGIAFKKDLKIPVMVISQHDPFEADRAIADGKFDISALGRQLLCDPEYPTKLAEGRPKDIVRCLRCNTCMLRGLGGLHLACQQNPDLGREYLLDAYKMGPRRPDEPAIPASWVSAKLPALDKTPWWRTDIEVVEKAWRPFRGPGPR
jgi:2,4-dienoyl-CoA reductase-like NADH-dependent reductase (Old Yellow Enzyme family)